MSKVPGILTGSSRFTVQLPFPSAVDTASNSPSLLIASTDSLLFV